MKFNYKDNPNTVKFWDNYYTKRVVERKNNWLFDMVLAYLAPYTNPVAIEVGCGGGRTIIELCKLRRGVRWTGLDFSASGIKRANLKYAKYAKWWCDDIVNVAKRSEVVPVFDFILCVETLEHLSEPEIVCGLFFQWLKADGIILITVPVAGSALDKGKDNLHHVTYEPEDFFILFPQVNATVRTFQIDKHHLGVTIKKE